MSWVFDHSPYTLGTRLIHLAIADIVNDDNDWLLWASKSKIATKAKVSPPTVTAAFARMVKDGYLELIESHVGRPSVYRFVTDPGQQISEPPPDVPDPPPTPQENRPTPQADGGGPPSSPQPVLLPTQLQPKQNQPTGAIAPADPRWQAVEHLCEHLAAKMTQHRNGERPRISKQWRKDMDLLIRKGAKTWDEPHALEPDYIARIIDGVFTLFAEPEGNSTFCWADVIQSPTNLRAKWDRIITAGRTKIKAAARANPLDRPVDIAGRLTGPTDLANRPTRRTPLLRNGASQ